MLQLCRMKVEELIPRAIISAINRGFSRNSRRTLIVPSKVLAMTSLFKESLARPVIVRCPFFLVDSDARSSTGQGPTLNVLRLMPDCIFHM